MGRWPEWVAVCRLDEIREGRGVSRDADGVRVAVFRSGDEVVALSGAARMPTARWDWAGSRTARWSARCTDWRFRLADGRCTTVRGNSVHRFRCEVRGEEVWVQV